MDFILNGQASGDVATRLMQCNFDPGALRPYVGANGQAYISVTNGYDSNGNAIRRSVPVNNATATLRKDDWKLLDAAIVKAAKPRLRLVADLRSRGQTFNLPNGMAHTVLETETQGDITAATISMDGVRQSQEDRPEFELKMLPLPIIHKDFSFSLRQLQASRNGGSPLDTTTAELAARRVAEEAEKLALGTAASYTYGGGTVYGLTNYPSRLTHSLTAPTASGWTGATLVQQVLAMMQKSRNAYHYGPWTLYAAPAWTQYLDDDYSAAKGDNTLRERVNKIDGLSDVKTLDYLTNYDLILMQETTDVFREVIGMDFTTLQWESKGGLMQHFKVMAIMVPQARADQNGNTGIVHGSV